jgi:hypothetical protein
MVHRSVPRVLQSVHAIQTRKQFQKKKKPNHIVKPWPLYPLALLTHCRTSDLAVRDRQFVSPSACLASLFASLQFNHRHRQQLSFRAYVRFSHRSETPKFRWWHESSQAPTANLCIWGKSSVFFWTWSLMLTDHSDMSSDPWIFLRSHFKRYNFYQIFRDHWKHRR